MPTRRSSLPYGRVLRRVRSGAHRDRPALPRQAATAARTGSPVFITGEKTLSAASRRRSKLEAIDSPPGDGDLLSSSELARLMSVNTKTIARWAANGGLPSIRTLGGRRRYRSVRPTTKRGRRAPTARRPRGCSQRRPSALRVYHAAHRRVLAPTARGRRHTIRPAMPLPRAPGRDAYGRPRPGIRRMTRPPALVAEPLVAARPLASWNLSECAWTYSAPFVATP
jgi:excisionase family DNA binding protein